MLYDKASAKSREWEPGQFYTVLAHSVEGAVNALNEESYRRWLAKDPDLPYIVGFQKGEEVATSPGSVIWNKLEAIAKDFLVEVYPAYGYVRDFVPWTGSRDDIRCFLRIRISARERAKQAA